MSGKFIGLILAASVAVTGMTAAPAQAVDRELAQALAVIAGVAVVGTLVHENRKDRRQVVTRGYPYRAYRPAPRRPAIAQRAYRRGYHDARRAERRHHDHRRAKWGHHDSQYYYSARPHRGRR